MKATAPSSIATRLTMVAEVFLVGKSGAVVSNRRLPVISDRPFERAD